MSAGVVVDIVIIAALFAAAFWAGWAVLRLWRHTGQRVDRLADPAPMPEDGLRREDMRWLPPAPPVWSPRITDRFPQRRDERTPE